jgi:hypothetical protein
MKPTRETTLAGSLGVLSCQCKHFFNSFCQSGPLRLRTLAVSILRCFAVVRQLISVAICFAIGLLVLVQVAAAI